ncbi:MAG: hypothetical protein Dasosvirus12_2 [Dasosvirus sp.]|uniref:CAAX prenyl protease 2/Lysostaphin resistance protein A-like domain-containing protein n=1 Tax=Dasosvirus sp. TaxID=2487764 RepID=A0A3G4ZRU3_9VIRU|nr:MAG: hypothetical protein Dasosvirus12_2 [Dasosvirus sp.]
MYLLQSNYLSHGLFFLNLIIVLYITYTKEITKKIQSPRSIAETCVILGLIVPITEELIIKQMIVPCLAFVPYYQFLIAILFAGIHRNDFETEKMIRFGLDLHLGYYITSMNKTTQAILAHGIYNVLRYLVKYYLKPPSVKNDKKSDVSFDSTNPVNTSTPDTIATTSSVANSIANKTNPMVQESDEEEYPISEIIQLCSLLLLVTYVCSQILMMMGYGSIFVILLSILAFDKQLIACYKFLTKS